MPDLDEEYEPTREEVDRFPGLVLLEFGTSWCGYCNVLRPHVASLLAERPQVRHIRVEDGPGRPLGRSFQVKLWPTFIVLRDGKVIERLVRPAPAQVRAALETVQKVD